MVPRPLLQLIEEQGNGPSWRNLVPTKTVTVFWIAGMLFSLAIWSLVFGYTARHPDATEIPFEWLPLLPFSLSFLSLIILNALTSRSDLAHSEHGLLFFGDDSHRPVKRAVVFGGIIGGMMALAVAVLAGLIRYVPRGEGDLSAGMIASAMFMLTRYELVYV